MPDEKEGTVRSAVKLIPRPLLTTRGRGGDETTLSLSLGRLLLSNRRLLSPPDSRIHSLTLDGPQRPLG